MSRKTLGLLLTAVLLGAGLAGIPPATAQSYTVYVAPNGSDSNSGTRSQPMATMQAAMLRLPDGGKILLRGGDYTITNSSSVLWQGGTASRPLVVRSAPGERARLTSTEGNHCVLAADDYIRIRNLDCTGFRGISSYNASYIVIRGNYVHDLTADRTQGILASGDSLITNIKIRGNTVRRVPHTGIAVGATRAGAASKVVIKNNKVRKANYQFRSQPTAAGGWGSGISAVGADNVLIRNNDVRRTYGEGINCALSNNCRVRRNVVVDAYGTLYYGDNASNSVWEDNVAKTTRDSRFFRDYGFGGIEAAGFVIANEAGWFSGPGRAVEGNIFRNNIAINVNVGWRFGDYGNADAGMRNTVVANNTFVGVSNCGIWLYPAAANSGNTIVNNLVVPEPGAAALCGGARGVSLRNNLWARGSVRGGLRSGDVRAMPSFRVGSGLRPSSYRLTAGSPGVDDGRALAEVTDDKRKVARPKGGQYDIGAFER